MATKLDQMITAQPGALRELRKLDVSEHARRLSTASRLLLVGTGTSFHAAQLGAYLLRAGGLDAEAVPSAEFVGWRQVVAPGDGVIVITHTGETAYARAARAAVQALDVPLVTITGPQVDWDEAIRTPVAEQAETYTVSYTAALAVLGLLAHQLAGTHTGPDALAPLAEQVGAVIADPGISQIAPPIRALALVAPGIWSVTAREGALKLRESAHLLAEGFDAEGLLHGAAVPYGEQDTLLGLAPDADPDGLTGALIRAAAADGITTHLLGEATVASAPAQTFLAQIPATVRLQLLAAAFSAARGTDPDTVITGPWADAGLWSAGSP